MCLLDYFAATGANPARLDSGGSADTPPGNLMSGHGLVRGRGVLVRLSLLWSIVIHLHRKRFRGVVAKSLFSLPFHVETAP